MTDLLKPVIETEELDLPLEGALEAILFASGEPVPLDRLANALGKTAVEIKAALEHLKKIYEADEKGICIQELGSSWQMCTKTSFAPAVRRAMEIKKQAPLSQAAMETLTIVAYNQPVTKSFVEQVRGVDSASVVNSLVEKELLAENGRLDLPGRPIAYVTTPHFLRSFGLRSLADLPPLPDIPRAAEESQ